MYKITAGLSLAFLGFSLLWFVLAIASQSYGWALIFVMLALLSAINFVDDLVKAIHYQKPIMFDNDDGSNHYD